MGEVYLAASRGEPGLRKLVVIKRVRAELASDDEYRAMLLEEARFAVRLDHPNIVHTFEVGVFDGRPYLAMEYLEGQPLGRVLRAHGKMPPLLASRLMADALAGLHAAHELTDYDGRPLGIVHRDVSPQNLFVTYAGVVKVVDFGVAKATQSGDKTKSGVLKGKLAYMSPEHVKEEAVDRRADVFAAGIVLWELLTGRRLFKPKHGAHGVALVLYEPIPPPSREAPDVPPALDSIVLRAVERDPAVRWATAGEMREALYDFMRGLPGGLMRRDEVGKIVAHLFERERADAKKRIADFMARAATGSEEQIGALERLSPGSSVPPSSGISNEEEVRTVPARPGAARNEESTPPPAERPEPSKPSEPSTLETVQADEKDEKVTTDTRTSATVSTPGGTPRRAGRGRALGALVGLALVAGAAAFALRPPQAAPPVTPATAAPSTASALPAPPPVMIMAGSGTIGVGAVPALVAGYLRKRGASAVETAPGSGPDTVVVIGTMRPDAKESVLVRSEGTHAGVACLLRKECDVAMAARAADDAEVAEAREKGLGDLRSPLSEHVIALDGISIIVNPSNPVRSLDRDQLGRLFAGEIRDWHEVGGAPGPVALMSHEEGSGTYDLVGALLLRGRRIDARAKLLPDNDALTSSVVLDPSAIGYVGFPFVRGARPLAVGDPGLPALVPSPFTIAGESYLLSRRFYFYTSPLPKPGVLELVDWVASADGQRVLRDTGYVDLEPTLAASAPCDPRCPSRYAAATKHARRLSTDFRFRDAEAHAVAEHEARQLDARAVADIDRVIRFLHLHPSGKVMLLGFVDATGDARADERRAKELARAVDVELAARGARATVVDGFGGEMPLAANRDDWGRRKNRRVETWLEGVSE
jgi:serine/threonine-protein kinase